MISESIKKDFIEVLKSYGNSTNPHFSFDTYENNKKRFYEEFGNKLIISKPTRVISSPNARQKLFDDFLSYISIRRPLSEFIRLNGVEGFFLNQVMIKHETDDGLKIPVGMKLSKSFKFFIEDAWSLDYVQTKYSQSINNDGLYGDLCLSIHPLDYLSISQNNNGWRSCQSLDGEYASGTLSLMNDKVTIVAYLGGQDSDRVFTGQDTPSWNTKKWRVLVHIDKNRNRIMFSKHYPFTCVELEDEVIKMLNEVYPGDWEKSQISSADRESKIGNTKGRSNYNDITTGNNICYQLTNGKESDKILVGSEVPCIHCGKDSISQSEYFACDTCYDEDIGHVCEYCGDGGILSEDMYYIDTENIHVCWHCWDRAFINCHACGNSLHIDDFNSEHDCCESCFAIEEAARIALEELANEQSRQIVQGEHTENS